MFNDPVSVTLQTFSGCITVHCKLYDQNESFLLVQTMSLWVWILLSIRTGTWDSWISVVTGLWAGNLGFNSQQGVWDFSFSHSVHASSGAYPASYFMGTGDSFQEVKWLGCDIDHYLHLA